MYRVKSTSTTPLGLAEFLALAAPFALHLAVGRYNFIVKAIGAAALLLFVYVIKLTDARLGMAGVFVGSLAYLFGWAVARWLKERGSLVKATIVFAYPALFCAAVTATFFVGKLRKAIWGGGATRASNNGRQAQLDRGIPIVLEQPWGHGPGQGGRALGYYSFSFLTIDNYYLAVALEYGIIGFVMYYGMILLAIWNGGKYYIERADLEDREQALLLPITASLCTFFVIKSVFSNQDNHPLMYMMLGMVVALVYRIKSAQPKPIPAPAGRWSRRRHGNARIA
jgi:O-antigen ligase